MITLHATTMWWMGIEDKIHFWHFVTNNDKAYSHVIRFKYLLIWCYIPYRTFDFCLYKYILHIWREMTKAHLFLIPLICILWPQRRHEGLKKIKCWINHSLFHRNNVRATWFPHSGPFMPVFSILFRKSQNTR